MNIPITKNYRSNKFSDKSEDILKEVDPTLHLVHITSTLNNTKATLTTPSGDALLTSSAGTCGFKKSHRSSTYAAQLVGENLAKYIIKKNIKGLGIKIKGIGKGKEHVLRGLYPVLDAGSKIAYIHDITTIPHNGCRPRKKRRL